VRFCSIGSGSRGNGTLVQWDGTSVLIDCGFSLAETELRLAAQGQKPEELSAILVTHEHGDHIRGVGVLSRRYGIPVYMTAGTWRGYRREDISALHCISPHEAFRIGALEIQPVAVPHDTVEPCQFVLASSRSRLGVLTDLGSITAHVQEAYRDCDALVLEFNHDEDLLEQGPYPASVKRRVASDWGHLSNRQAAAFLSQAMQGPLQHLVVAHISETNNSLAHAEAALAGLGQPPGRVHWAGQEEGCDWIEIG